MRGWGDSINTHVCMGTHVYQHLLTHENTRTADVWSVKVGVWFSGKHLPSLFKAGFSPQQGKIIRRIENKT